MTLVSLTSKVDKKFHSAVKDHIEKYNVFNPKLTISSYIRGLIEKDLANKEKYFINVRELLQEDIERLNKELKEKESVIEKIKEKCKEREDVIEALEEELDNTEIDLEQLTEDHIQKNKEARSLAKELKDTQNDLEPFRGSFFTRVWAAIKG